MAFFGRSFQPWLQAAIMGQIPGAIVEEPDPRLMASILNAPVPASGDFMPGSQPSVNPDQRFGQGYDPISGTMSLAGGAGMPGISPPSPSSDSGALSPLPISPPVNGARPMFGDLPQLPDHMGGINDALARNRAMASPPSPLFAQLPKKKNNVGKFLGAWAGHLGDSLTGNPAYANSLQHKRRLEEAEREAQLKAQLPQQVGQSIIVPDGRGGYKTLFRDPSTPEAYAIAQGFQPGAPEYAEAVRQYRLGSWNDEAVEAKRGLTSYRYDRQGGLQEDRQTFSREMQDDRQGHSDSQLGRRLGVTRRGQDITRDNNIRSTGQSDTNNRRSTSTSRANNVQTNNTRLRTARRDRGQPVLVNTPQEARSLPPGTLFMTPDGRVKRR